MLRITYSNQGKESSIQTAKRKPEKNYRNKKGREKKDEVTGGWRKLHNEELHNLYSSPSIIRMIRSRRMRWTGHVERMGDKRNEYTILVGNPEGKRPPGRPRCRWVDSIKMSLR
jgi:hypothetical protein